MRGPAKQLFLTARTFSATELLDLGYLDEIAPAEWIRGWILSPNCSLLTRPQPCKGMKRSLNEIARGEADAAALHGRYLESLRSEDFREGVTAFREKRAPRFGGR